MLKKQPQSLYGAWHINTAQAIVILIAIGCGGVIFNAYQQAHQSPPALTLTDVSPKPNPNQARYAARIQAWQAKMAQMQITVTCPYHGLDNVARIDLPDRIPAWDDAHERDIAKQAYNSFYQTRKKVPVVNPGSCIVRVFLADGSLVALASASGVVTSADQDLGNS